MFRRRKKSPVKMHDNRVHTITVKRSILDDHLKMTIVTQAGERFEFHIHQGLAWRLRHMIHKILGFDDQELARGQRYSQWHGMEN